MHVPDGFDSWGSYRAFAERSQWELFVQLRDAFEQSALEPPDNDHGIGGGLFGSDAQLDVDWYVPFVDTWIGTDLIYADDVTSILWLADRNDYPEYIGQVQEVIKSEGVAHSAVDDEQYFHYETQAPAEALATEIDPALAERVEQSLR